MYRIIFVVIMFFILVGCSSNAVTKPSSSKVSKTKLSSEVFDAFPGKDLKQISAEALTRGWMYTLTNGGVPIKSKHLTKWLVSVEIIGQESPLRLKSIFPKQCQELSFSKKIEKGFPTWVDILSCPYHETKKDDGLLVVTKAIQGTKKFFGATLYRLIPSYDHKVSKYQDLPLSEVDKRMIKRFIDKTTLTKRY